MMEIQEIMEYLPHRYPFLLVDRVLEINEEEHTIVAIKNVTMNELFFQGHFPGEPVMPGVLIIEALAQAAGLCSLHINKTDTKGKVILFMAIDKVKFRKKVVPGDQLRFEVKVLRPGSKVAQYDAKAYVGDNLVAEGILTAMVSDRE